ncbi:hypothetical protein BDA96_06G006200 [Sorghum bicolor]|uniref:Xylanase inhibitor C-terminal domain-containing protein n=2 Tax=Sorghum bicolor TaxID=4558 RepID=A0A921QQD3_SORBI|nr:uncharacterized protein LOC8066530 [Sorghum bicolor]KAG0524880.1 hypothetical protein BDA96_06G006200 [Sorghum bicolor]OQU81065.1 hypothetical protein SORBI_3006G006000 [Sorghum bicolor]|eukprot:XP_002446033.1 uncharacterized protein LOC8066530 [Sorghum bicolor]
MAKQFLVLAVLFVACKIAAATTVYDVLEQNNLPRGLLPLGVKSYVLHPDGALEVTLPKECNFFITVGGTKLQFRYGTSVNGIIKSGSISRVSGVRFQVKFAWLGINQVSHTGNQINLQVERSTKSFPASAFSQSPSCN